MSCMQLAKNWWTNCETQPAHSRCSQTLSGGKRVDPNLTPLPNRCIRVTSRTANAAACKKPIVEIALEETQGRRGQYICLSHRWVQPDTRRSSTVKSNYDARLCGTDFSQLPPLFTHAFQAAAQFGIQYVWIDSICIIQDHSEDWDQESANMGRYYQFAAFTLISTFSPEDTPSFSGYSPPTPDSIARLPYRDKTGAQRGHFYVYPRTSQALLAAKWASHVNDSQLLTRGWIFQEWLLSRRIVCLTV